MLRHRLHAWLSNTAAPAVLSVSLVGSFLFLAFQPHGSRGAIAEAAVAAQLPQGTCGCCSESNRQTRRFDVFRTAGGTYDIRPERFERPSNPRAVDQMVILVNREDTGLFAPTNYNRWAKIIGPSTTDLFTRQSELREQLINQTRYSLGRMSFGAQRHALIQGKVAQLDGTSAFGITYNAATMLLFALLCWSAKLNAHKLSPSRLLRDFRTTPPDQCPHCRYSTIGLTNDTCPECGGSIAERTSPQSSA